MDVLAIATSRSHLLRAFTSTSRSALAPGSVAVGTGGSSTTVAPGIAIGCAVYFCDGVVPRDYSLLPSPAQNPMQWLVSNAHPTGKVLVPVAVQSNRLPPPYLPLGRQLHLVAPVGVSVGTPRRILSICCISIGGLLCRQLLTSRSACPVFGLDRCGLP
jgi:hypothetical protein